MRLQDRVTLTLTLLSALMLVGCGKNETEDLANFKAQVAKQDANTARVALKSLIQAHPASGEARYLLGQQLLADGQAPLALIEFQRALEFKFTEDKVLPVMAEAMIQTGEAKRVIKDFADKKLADPESMARLLAALANAQALQGDLPAAQASTEQALKTAPKSAPALLFKARLAAAANDNQGSMALLEQLLVLHPDDYAAWAMKGDLLLRTPNGMAPAMAAFGQAVRANPNHVYSQSALVALSLAQSELDGAKKHFATLKKIAPKHPNTALFDAQLAYATGDFARARDIHQGLLRALPENVNVLLSAGETELKLNAALQAEALFAKALTLAPRSVLARRLLAQADLQLGQPAKALLTLAPLVDAPDASPDVLALAAQAHLLNGDPRGADALYTRMATLKPVDPRLRTLVATAGFGKDRDEAVFSELRSISSSDTGTTADMALISGQLRRGQLDAALKSLDALEHKRPKDPVAPQLRGQVQAQKGDMAAARKSFDQALVIDANYVPAVTALAQLDLRDKHPEAARQRYLDLLKRQPKDAQVMLSLAALLQSQGAPNAEVQKQLEDAVKAAPRLVDARVALISHHFNRNNIDAALTAAQAATSALPDNIDLLELQGRCHLRAHQVSQALASYGKVALLLPKSPRAYVGMADVHLANNELDQAQRNINRALELAPDLPEAQAQGIAVALRKKQFAQAVVIARRMQAQRADSADGYLLEGAIESSRSHWDAAAAALRRALATPEPGAAAIKLYQVLTEAGKTSDANAAAESWLKAHPQDLAFLFTMADMAQQKGDNAAAEKRYEQVLALQPEHALALNNLAMLHIQLKKPGARALAERAVKAAPEQPALLDTLAHAYAQENEVGKAITTQKHALALAPTAGELRLGLARFYIQSGEKALAKAELDNLASQGKAFAQQEEVATLKRLLGTSLAGR